MIETSTLFLLCLLFSSLSFIFYGWGCLRSVRVELEFRRYQLERYRKLVGTLQLIASIGLIGGLWLPALGAAAAIGLSVLMAMGLMVRLRLRDSVVQMLPAAMYLLLNAYLAFYFLKA